MGNKRKKSGPVEGTAKGTYPLPARLTAEKVFTQVTQQVGTVEACPDYTNQPAVQSTCATLKGSLGTLSTLITKLGNARALVLSLEHDVGLQVGVVRRDQSAVTTSVNTACAGQEKLLLAYGTTLLGHAAALPVVTDAPLNVSGKALGNGLVLGECASDKAAKCYLFQIGTTPANPDTWPTPVVSNGCRHKFSATPGQKIYFRVAVQRRRSGLGLWSDIVEVTVR
jgi:hypothetical protein